MTTAIAKTVSMTCVHLVVACSVAYAMTGSAALGGVFAVVEALCNIAASHAHDKVWSHVRGVRGGVAGAVA